MKIKTGRRIADAQRLKRTAVRVGLACAFIASSGLAAAQPTALENSLEMLWDMDRIASLYNVRLTLHPPKLREVAIVHDQPWEGNVCCYHTVFNDGSLYRMYYRGANWGGTDVREQCAAKSAARGADWLGRFQAGRGEVRFWECFAAG